MTEYFVENRGSENELSIDEEVIRVGAFKIIVLGSNNKLIIGARTRLGAGLIEFKSNNSTIVIGEDCLINGHFRCRANNTSIAIGDQTTMMNSQITLHEKGSISIGRDCMLSGDVRMDVSDMHSILDVTTMQRINPPEDIRIDDHVWIGQGVHILKGSIIESNSILGAKAVVCSEIPSGVIAVGIPAKVVKKGVTWDRKCLPI